MDAAVAVADGGKEITAIGTDWKTAVGRLLRPAQPARRPDRLPARPVDEPAPRPRLPADPGRHLNNVGLALMGWITVILTAAGAVGGSVVGGVLGAIAAGLASLGVGAPVGGAAGAGVGGATGAGIGFGIALTIGELLTYSFSPPRAPRWSRRSATLRPRRQTDDEKVRDYNQAAESGIGWRSSASCSRCCGSAGRSPASPRRTSNGSSPRPAGQARRLHEGRQEGAPEAQRRQGRKPPAKTSESTRSARCARGCKQLPDALAPVARSSSPSAGADGRDGASARPTSAPPSSASASTRRPRRTTCPRSRGDRGPREDRARHGGRRSGMCRCADRVSGAARSGSR